MPVLSLLFLFVRLTEHPFVSRGEGRGERKREVARFPMSLETPSKEDLPSLPPSLPPSHLLCGRRESDGKAMM